jgi:hypothetical protein
LDSQEKFYYGVGGESLFTIINSGTIDRGQVSAIRKSSK